MIIFRITLIILISLRPGLHPRLRLSMEVREFTSMVLGIESGHNVHITLPISRHNIRDL